MEKISSQIRVVSEQLSSPVSRASLLTEWLLFMFVVNKSLTQTESLERLAPE